MDGTAERSDKPVGSGHRGTNFQKSFAPANQSVSSFDFIYDLVAPYYPANGRLFIAPVSMFKMLLVGYLYGIKSERRLVQEVQTLRIAGFAVSSSERRYQIILRSVKQEFISGMKAAFSSRFSLKQKLIDDKEMASDGSYIPAEVSRNSWIGAEVEVEQSMLSHLDDLDQELVSQPGFKKPLSYTVTTKNYDNHNRS